MSSETRADLIAIGAQLRSEATYLTPLDVARTAELVCPDSLGP
jgi:hypothetical protein